MNVLGANTRTEQLHAHDYHQNVTGYRI